MKKIFQWLMNLGYTEDEIFNMDENRLNILIREYLYLKSEYEK
jgi:hypothetical protein